MSTSSTHKRRNPKKKQKRNFTASGLGKSDASASARNSNNSYAGSVGSARGGYSAREENLKRDEEAGRLKFLFVSNNHIIDEHMIRLIELKNIFVKHLLNMPKEYIVRLMMDRTHKSVIIILRNRVIGGITYRPCISQKFGEIAFVAVTVDQQTKGYGTRLMNHLKQQAQVDELTHFLTYADNHAVGYFSKQGFTKEIYLEKDIWDGYIKDYDGGILMECKIDHRLPYTDLSMMVMRQRQAIVEKIREVSNSHIVYPGIEHIPKRVEDIPGLKEAGWTPDQWGHSQFKTLSTSSSKAIMSTLVKLMADHDDSWPFKEPVDASDVPDYYEIIKNPIDLKTISNRVELGNYYVTFDMFRTDVRRMFTNANTYNSPDTIYYRCSNSLQAYFESKVQSSIGLQ